MADLHVTGLAELQKFLDTFPAKLEANVMRGALRAGMNVVKPVAASNVHSISGDLARTLAISTSIKRGMVTAKLKAGGVKLGVLGKGLTKKARSYLASRLSNNLALWVEYGTRAHFISVPEEEKPINTRKGIHFGQRVSMTTINRAVRSLRIGNAFVGPTVWHPGAKPSPFMRPALDSQAQNAVVAAAEYMKKRLATKEGIETSDISIEVES